MVLRQGDSVLISIEDASKETYRLDDSIRLCLDSELVLSGTETLVEFESGLRAALVDSRGQRATLLTLQAHDGVVNSVEPVFGTSSALQVRWAKCSVSSDEVFATQMLFAFGSITSIIVVILVLIDSRFKRDKYS